MTRKQVLAPADASVRDLIGRAKRVLVGGALGRFRLPDEVNTVLARGKGSRVWDLAGREYIDYVLGSGPMLLGHAHPAVMEAVQTQLPRGTTYFFLNEHAIRLAEKLVEAVPCAESVRYLSSGTEATHLALRCARAYTGRSKILKFEGGWHGMHDYALWGAAPARPSDYPKSRPDSAGIPPSVGEDVLVAPFNETELAVRIIEQHAAELAAVIVEPLQRVLLPEPGFLEALRNVTRKHGIVLIYDEIVTGFRIAWGGAQEKYGVVPDMATYGKAMAGGFPLSAIVGSEGVMAAFDGGSRPLSEVAWASGTFNGNPVAAAAGLAALEVLSQPGTYDRLHRTGARLRKGLEDAGRRHGFPARALGEDAVFGLRFIDKPNPRTWMDLQAHDARLGNKWAIECIKRGLLLVPNEKIYISITHTDEDVDQTLEIFEEAFAACVG